MTVCLHGGFIVLYHWETRVWLAVLVEIWLWVRGVRVWVYVGVGIGEVLVGMWVGVRSDMLVGW